MMMMMMVMMMMDDDDDGMIDMILLFKKYSRYFSINISKIFDSNTSDLMTYDLKDS